MTSSAARALWICLAGAAAGCAAQTPQPAPKRNLGADDVTPRLDRIRVAMIHAKPIAGDLAANWKTFERLVRQAAAEKADLCVSPECFLDGYAVSHAKWNRQQLLAAGREAAKQYLPRLKALAREREIMLLFGTTYTAGKECFNSAFLVDRDGALIGRYDKTHLLDHDLRFDAGKGIPVFRTRFGIVGIMICADRRWPEVARTLRVQGARIILNPTYGMRHLANEWWMRTRSYENECWICFVHPTLSLVTDPHGNVHARQSSTAPGLLIADIDLRAMPTKMFDARRPELYRPLTAPANGVRS
jgi:predicted amidohydrolase